MKTVPNPTFSIKVASEAPGKANAADLLKLCLSQPPQGGFDLSTIRARLRVSDVLDKLSPGAEIVLEDADYNTARKCIEDFRWSAAHRDIDAFCKLFNL